MTGGPKFKKKEVLRSSQQFVEVYIRGRRLRGPHLTFFFRPNRLAYNRLGISVQKRRFKLSADRHYIQRRLREIYRLNKTRFLPGHDLIVRVQRFDKRKTPFKDLEREVLLLAQRAGLLQDREIKGEKCAGGRL